MTIDRPSLDEMRVVYSDIQALLSQFLSHQETNAPVQNKPALQKQLGVIQRELKSDFYTVALFSSNVAEGLQTIELIIGDSLKPDFRDGKNPMEIEVYQAQNTANDSLPNCLHASENTQLCLPLRIFWFVLGSECPKPSELTMLQNCATIALIPPSIVHARLLEKKFSCHVIAENESLPPLLTDPQNSERLQAFLALAAQKLLTINRGRLLQLERDQLNSRLRIDDDQRLLKQISDTSTAENERAGLEAIRKQVQEEVEDLQQILRERIRKEQRPSSEATHQLEALALGLSDKDLGISAEGKQWRLRIDSPFVDRLEDQISDLYRILLRKDLMIFGQVLKELKQRTETSLHNVTRTPRILELAYPDEEQVHRELLLTTKVRPAYQGQMPKKTFWARLGEGRRFVFMFLMFFSLVGSFIGVNWRSNLWVGLGFLAIFFGAFAYTFKSWREEEEDRRRDELNKAQTTLKQELTRGFNTASREKQEILNTHLTRIRKSLMDQVEATLGEGRELKKTEKRELGERIGLAVQRHQQRIATIENEKKFWQESLIKSSQIVQKLSQGDRSGYR